jgi:hypothetical protein
LLIYAVYSNTVEKVRYDEENRRVYFNKEQYFKGVSKAAWEYQIGGYPVQAKYLKDRKKRELSLDAGCDDLIPTVVISFESSSRAE